MRAPLAQHEARAAGTGVVPARERLVAEEHPVGAAVARSASRGPRAQAASSRTVVVLPFEPVTTAVGMSSSALQGTAATSGSAASAKSRPPRAGAERQQRLIEHVRQRARRGGREQPHQVRARLARGEPRETLAAPPPPPAPADDQSGIGRVLECRRRERRLEAAPARRIAREQRRAQRPLVDFGGGKSWSSGRRERERCTARVRAARRRPARSSRAGARPRDARAPAARAAPHRARGPRSRARAPARAKNRLAPVRRREASNGSAAGAFSRRPPERTAHRARRGSAPRGPAPRGRLGAPPAPSAPAAEPK